MEISLYQIDAFASKLFEGNPAAVCPLEEWLPDEIMQSIRVKQLSSRGGELTCEIVDDRVLISGRAIKYLEGKIKIET